MDWCLRQVVDDFLRATDVFKCKLHYLSRKYKLRLFALVFTHLFLRGVIWHIRYAYFHKQLFRRRKPKFFSFSLLIKDSFLLSLDREGLLFLLVDQRRVLGDHDWFGFLHWLSPCPSFLNDVLRSKHYLNLPNNTNLGVIIWS